MTKLERDLRRSLIKAEAERLEFSVEALDIELKKIKAWSEWVEKNSPFKDSPTKPRDPATVLSESVYANVHSTRHYRISNDE